MTNRKNSNLLEEIASLAYKYSFIKAHTLLVEENL